MQCEWCGEVPGAVCGGEHRTRGVEGGVEARWLRLPPRLCGAGQQGVGHQGVHCGREFCKGVHCGREFWSTLWT